MIKKLIKKKVDSLVSAVGGVAVLVGSYLVMAAANRYLEKKRK